MRKQKIGFLAMALGACFLFNPPVGTTDILPDLVGYLLLYLGIAKFADLNDDLANAQRAFRNMLWLGLGEIFAYLLTEIFLKNPTLQLNRYERPVWILLFTFVFLVFEWFFMLPAWRKFFKGFSMLAEYHGGSYILKERRGKTLCERMISRSTAFVIVKPLLALIPELFVLTSFEKDAENPVFKFDWYTYAETFRILLATVSCIVGLIWLVSFLRLMARACADRVWQEELRSYYETEVLPDQGFLLRRRIGTSFAFFRVGTVFLINLTLLHYEFLPDWFSALLFLCGALVLGELFGDLRAHVASSVFLIGVGILRMVLDIRYLQSHIPMDALYQPSAYAQYLPIRVLGVAEVVLGLLLALLTVRSLCGIAWKHTAVVYEGDAALSARATERVHRQIRKKACLTAIFLAVSSVAKIFEILVLQESFAWIWIIQVAASVAAVIVFSSFAWAISEQIDEKYSSEKRA